MTKPRQILQDKMEGFSNRGRERVRSESGQALLEVALLTPLLLLLLIGVIDLGRYAYEGLTLTNAARAGAGYGAQTPLTAADPNGMCGAASTDFFDGAATTPTCSCNTITSTGKFSCTGTATGRTPSSITVSESGWLCQCDTSGGASGGCDPPPTCGAGVPTVTSVQVTAAASFSPLFAYPGVPSSLAISRTAIMRIGN